ncbi:MAG: beta-lactamase [Microbacteriaceae bacterium]|jgi:L-ascorbate metabolism protein UlaG (beta-lactamase superfamily)|nr:beta-lactamase [Microbacteriaceae bacterium]HEV7957521.1 MBL fold metallo-hydrolase [Marisediminicola sp.]
MKLTKREHSCLLLEMSGDTLIIDPGSFTLPLEDARGVVAIVITHEHPDHWTPEHLRRILDVNPDARILGPAGVAAAATEFDVRVVAAGDALEVGNFALRFFGGKHAEIHRSIPIIDNVGVLVNEELYYAGDSYSIPDGVEVGTLAVPAGAPWLKIGEVIDYVSAVKPKRSFPVHEMVLSVAGKGMSNGRIEAETTKHGGQFFALEPGESIDL